MLKHRIDRLERLANHGQAPLPALPPARRLQTVQDVIDLLEEQVEFIRASPWLGALQRAQAIGVLAGIARKAIVDGNLSARIEMLEAVLKQRRGDMT